MQNSNKQLLLISILSILCLSADATPKKHDQELCKKMHKDPREEEKT